MCAPSHTQGFTKPFQPFHGLSRKKKIVVSNQGVIGMAEQAVEIETVPQTVPDEVKPPRKVLRAGEAAVEAYRQKVREAQAVAEQQQREREEAEAAATKRGLGEAKARAEAKGEEVAEEADGRVVVGRDGLDWLYRKGKLIRPHYEAGLRFRSDFELANGSGMVSCLVLETGGSFGPKAGATDRQIRAHAAVKEALSVEALGSPLLRPYIVYVAGMGEMLSGSRFGGSRQKADAHLHPCVIALDALARHYGMIR